MVEGGGVRKIRGLSLPHAIKAARVGSSRVGRVETASRLITHHGRGDTTRAPRPLSAASVASHLLRVEMTLDFVACAQARRAAHAAVGFSPF